MGKSTLINSLGGPCVKVARTSPNPGYTDQINFYRVGSLFSLVDMPGYGFADTKPGATEHWKALVRELCFKKKI